MKQTYLGEKGALFQAGVEATIGGVGGGLASAKMMVGTIKSSAATFSKAGEGISTLASKSAASVSDVASSAAQVAGDVASSAAASIKSGIQSVTGKFQDSYGSDTATQLRTNTFNADPEVSASDITTTSVEGTASLADPSTSLTASVLEGSQPIQSSSLSSVFQNVPSSVAPRDPTLTPAATSESQANLSTTTFTPADNALPAASAAEDAVSIVPNVGTSVVTDTASALTETATATASSALADVGAGAIAAVPVIGEVAGLAAAGFGIYEGFKDLFDPPKESAPPPAPAALGGSGGTTAEASIGTISQAGVA